MASAITHFIVGASLGWPFVDSEGIRGAVPRWAIPISAGVMGAAPDLDVYSMRIFDIPYDSYFGHRGFFHSPFFLIIACVLLARGNVRLGALWSAAAITHPLLDMLTDGGLGVILLTPFSDARLFFPWHPIHVSPMSIGGFFSVAAYVLKSELPFCVIAVVLGGAARLPLRQRTPEHSAG
jgi:inner membrane protein